MIVVETHYMDCKFAYLRFYSAENAQEASCHKVPTSWGVGSSISVCEPTWDHSFVVRAYPGGEVIIRESITKTIDSRTGFDLPLSICSRLYDEGVINEEIRECFCMVGSEISSSDDEPFKIEPTKKIEFFLDLHKGSGTSKATSAPRYIDGSDYDSEDVPPLIAFFRRAKASFCKAGDAFLEKISKLGKKERGGFVDLWAPEPDSGNEYYCNPSGDQEVKLRIEPEPR